VKKYHHLDFMEINDPNQLCSHRDGKSCDFRKTFIEKFCGESVFVSYFYLQIREKIAPFCFFERMVSIIYLCHIDPKSFDF
jgi:hypothetical protein